jgi:hypothetical protein
MVSFVIGSSSLASLKWDAIAVAVISLAAGFFYYQNNLPLKRSDHEARQGSRPPDRLEGDTLLLLPNTPPQRADNIEQLDCTYGWFNTLTQELGSFGTALTKNFSPELLTGRQTVILPPRVVEIMPQTGVDVLDKFVRKGGNLILSKPDADWQSLTDLKHSDKRVQFDALRIDDNPYSKQLKARLPDELPAKGEVIRLQSRPDDILMSTESGYPALVAHSHEEGRVLSFLFDFACTQVRLHQGVFDVDSSGSSELRTPLDKRLNTEAFQKNKIPHADLLEDYIFSTLGANSPPTAHLWQHPGIHLGTVTTSIADVGPGSAASVLARWIDDKDIRTTVFRLPSLNRKEIALQQDSPSNGLLWRRRRDFPTREISLATLPLLKTELTLTEQLDSVANQYTPSVKITHVPVQQWSETPMRLFQQLSGANVQLDQSLGTQSPDQFGYSHATSYPFYPLDRNGLPIPTLELPFALHARNIDPKRSQILLDENRQYFHGVVSTVIPSHFMQKYPSGDRMAGLMALFGDTTDKQWLTDLHRLNQFHRARRESVLSSRWDGKTNQLEVTAKLEGIGDEQRYPPGIAVPSEIPTGLSFQKASTETRQISSQKIRKLPHRNMVVLEQPAGSHNLTVQYR